MGQMVSSSRRGKALSVSFEGRILLSRGTLQFSSPSNLLMDAKVETLPIHAVFHCRVVL